MLTLSVLAVAQAGGCRAVAPAASGPLIPMPVGEPAASGSADVLRGVGVEPKTIHPADGQKAVIRYDLPEPARVTLDLVDADGRIARRIDAGDLPAGVQETVWDGRMNAGEWAPPGVYRYVISIQTHDGHTRVQDASAVTGGEELNARAFTYDDTSGHLRWVMPKAGYARLRIGIQGFPHLRTLLDWQPLEAGEHTLDWDGMDASGLIALKDHPKRLIKLNVFSMPENTVIVDGTPSGAVVPGPAAYASDQKPAGSYLHARHGRSRCGEVPFSVDFLVPGLRRDAEGRPLLPAAAVPVRVTLDPAHAARAVNGRFEVSLYEDLNFLFEEENGSQPFTFEWKTEGLTPGVHLLTVNLMTYDDHYGVVTVPVSIEHP